MTRRQPANILQLFTGKKWPDRLQCLCLVLALCATTANSLADNFTNHQIKAVFLFNFANFVHWPEEAFEETSSPFVFCASKPNSPTVKTLHQVIRGESLKQHKLILKAPFNPEKITDCHILFLEKDDIARYQNQLPGLSAASVLTVSDTRRFVDKGGLIELAQNKNRIQPTINSSQLEQSKLKVSSTLLRLANIYRAPAKGLRP